MNLPEPEFYYVADLAREWGCHPDRVLCYLAAGNLDALAIVHASAIPECALAVGYALVRICYPALVWNDDKACLAGPHTAVLPSGAVQEFEGSTLTIRRTDIAIADDEKRRFEAAGRLGDMDARERRTLLRMVGTLTRLYYGDDALEHVYARAREFCDDASRKGLTFTEETVAKKLLAAREKLKASAQPKQCEVLTQIGSPS